VLGELNGKLTFSINILLFHKSRSA
jgi:hypothetical protein